MGPVCEIFNGKSAAPKTIVKWPHGKGHFADTLPLKSPAIAKTHVEEQDIDIHHTCAAPGLPATKGLQQTAAAP